MKVQLFILARLDTDGISVHRLRMAWFFVACIIVGGGCGSPSSTTQKSTQQGVESEIEQPEPEYLTNIKPRTADQKGQPTLQPKFSRDEKQILLDDLSLVLRKVVLDKPIDEQTALWFSESEITNQMFAAFLNGTGQWRDDTELAKAEEQRRQGTRNADGSVMFSFSTGSPSIDVHQQSALWRDGTFSAGLEDHPVTFVTIEQASSFCHWLSARYDLGGSFRIPTEEEWLFAAYGTDRKFPWGNDERKWTGESTEPVKARPELRTPEGLYGMWGNASELVLSPSNGYGGEIGDKYSPMITQWLGTHYHDEEIRGEPTHPRQDYWGYTHSIESRSDTWGFRVVFVPKK